MFTLIGMRPHGAWSFVPSARYGRRKSYASATTLTPSYSGSKIVNEFSMTDMDLYAFAKFVLCPIHFLPISEGTVKDG
jgi:hypothetical protein